VKPIFVINTLSETVARKGSALKRFATQAEAVFDENIFEDLDIIIAAGQKSGWVIIEGGDGTSQGVLSAFLQQFEKPQDLPKFTLIPGGMTNQVSKNIGLKSRANSKIETLLSGATREATVPLLHVSSDGYPDLYGFLFSTGGVPMITNYTKDKLHNRGIGGSAAVLGGIIKGVSGRENDVLQSTDIALSVDGKDMAGLHLGTIVTTLPSLIMGLDPFWGDGDGALRLTYVTADAQRLPHHVVSLWAGRKNIDRSKDGLHSFNASKLTYNYGGPIVLDGEALTLGKTFTVTPTQPIRFVS
jgi:diacylglycerol kinase family enzyme